MTQTRSSLSTFAATVDGSDEGDNVSGVAGKVNPNILPQDFSKMTSVEVINILKKSVLFDARKFLVPHFREV